ncbi:MAG: hypothetical protein KC506_00625, partial [Nanoarchaeota archaeon]|nr:hypothetical protein [Nanoarchaeota archaeon]
NDYLLRFSFLTTLQYLNKKEQFTNSIYVYNGILVNFNLDKFEYVDGKKNDVVVKDMKRDYTFAKDKLRELTSKKVQALGEMLNKNLEKELARIDNHFGQQIKEIEDQMQKLRKKLDGLKDEEKIKKVKESLEKLENSNDLEKFNREKNFFVKDERNKHSLNVNNKLMNTGVIYYPKYLFVLTVEREKGSLKKDVKIGYNPLVDRITSLFCESCERDIKKINFCPFGHLSCVKCLKRCVFCEDNICKKCETKQCSECGRDGCLNCVSKCVQCKREVCNLHSYSEGPQKFCKNCINTCGSCGKRTNLKLVKCKSCGTEVCSSCVKRKFVEGDIVECCKKCGG